MLEALAEARRRPGDLEPTARHAAVSQRGPQAGLAAALAVLEGEVQDVALLDRAAQELAPEGDLDRLLVDEAAPAELGRPREDRRALGQQVRDNPLEGRDVEFEQVRGVDRARGNFLRRPRGGGDVRRRAEALADLGDHALEVGAELLVALGHLEPGRDLRADELPSVPAAGRGFYSAVWAMPSGGGRREWGPRRNRP
jgi:hypothetical protein